MILVKDRECLRKSLMRDDYMEADGVEVSDAYVVDLKKYKWCE